MNHQLKQSMQIFNDTIAFTLLIFKQSGSDGPLIKQVCKPICCLFQPAFGFCANPIAGQTTF